MTGKSVLPAQAAGFRNTLAINMFNRHRKRGYVPVPGLNFDEIQQSDKIFKPGMTVVDLGAAPGGWSQYAVTQIGNSGRIIACDLYQWIQSLVWTSFRAIFVMN